MARIIIVDLETTCWATPKEQGAKIPETIEIGAVSVTSEGVVPSHFQRFVSPIGNPILTDFCQQLTSISNEQVSRAHRFPHVLGEFLAWCGCDFGLLSWGYFDKNQFKRDCEGWWLKEDWLARHESIKHYLAEVRGIDFHGFVMTKGLEMMGLSLEGTHHRALSDAKNIARIYSCMTEAERSGLLSRANIV